MYVCVKKNMYVCAKEFPDCLLWEKRKKKVQIWLWFGSC